VIQCESANLESWATVGSILIYQSQDKIKQKLSKVPKDRLKEINEFIELILRKSKMHSPNIVKFEGIRSVVSIRNKIPINLEEVVKRLNESDNYQIVDLSLDIVEVAKAIQGLELHDRLIVATGKYLEIPILTSDSPISNSNLIDVIWK
jgi:predicted nucleic acid-binding protein